MSEAAGLAQHARLDHRRLAGRSRTFRDFCERALYHPQRGFYSRRRPAEHFYTACELHPAFGWTLARAVAHWLRELKSQGVLPPYSILEMGSGYGLLARELLQGLRREHPELERQTRYIMVERSGNLLRASLQSWSANACVTGYSSLDPVAPVRGVFLTNELVDALPFHVLEKHAGRIYELYADDSGETCLGELSQPDLHPVAKSLADTMEEGQRHAVCLETRRWLSEAASRIEAGYLVTIDYGKRFGPSDVNPPRSYHWHATDHRITATPGERDITAPVDFSLLIAEGEKLGLSCVSYSSLAGFLLDHGLMDYMSAATDAERMQLKTLIHPEGMGEAFKVLVQKKLPEGGH